VSATPDMSGWSPGAALAEQAARRPDRPFIAFGAADYWSFGAFDEAVGRIAAGLARRGVGAGDRVLAMLGNEAELVQLWCAASRLGAVFVPVNPAYKGALFEHVANDSGAALIVLDGPLAGVLADSEARLPRLATALAVGAVEGRRPQRIRVEPFGALAGEAGDPPRRQVEARDVGAILYTSGTTGASKGVLLPNAQLHLYGLLYNRQLALRADDVSYCCLPLFHGNGLLLQVYGALQLGARIAVAPAFSASRWLADVRRCGATIANLLGVMAEFIRRQPARPDDADNPLRLIDMVPAPPALTAEFSTRFATRIVSHFGTTEINCPIYTPPGEDARGGSCGKLVEDWFEARIVDPETDVERPVGETGEFVVRPKHPWCFMSGYNNRPDATLETWRNLWHHTGDAMRQDADGWFHYVDRLKDRIRRRGENVSSFEVEQALEAHEAVAEAAVVGVPSGLDDGEQEIKACVVLKPGAAAGAAELSAHCEARLPRFAAPRYFELLPVLPKTPTQKVQKQALRQSGVGPGVWDKTKPA